MQPHTQRYTQQKLKDNPGKKSISFGPSKGKRQIHITARKKAIKSQKHQKKNHTNRERETHTPAIVKDTTPTPINTHREKKKHIHKRKRNTERECS
jgi:hypothetical protein